MRMTAVPPPPPDVAVSDTSEDAGVATDAAQPQGDPNDSVLTPQLFAPERVGVLAGPGATAPYGLQLFGTDLGWTFEHRGELSVLFGDTMPTARFYCDTPRPDQDDTLAALPLQPGADVPPLRFVTVPGQATQLATIRVNRAGVALKMGVGNTPLTGWSDGQSAFAIMGHVEFTTCPQGSGVCDADAGLTCVHDLGLCQPAVGDAVVGCDPASSIHPSCTLGQQCVAPETGYCVDLGSSQYDGTRMSLPYAIARSAEVALQSSSDPTVFDSVHTFVSKKFHNPIVRTLTRLGRTQRDYDYSPGYGGLLMWGRPAYFAEQGRQGHVYLLRHSLPLSVQDGALAFSPEFFAGVDADTGEPRWSSAQRDAVALAMDGKRNGDPSEPLPVLNQMAISWLGAPIRKWIMLYAGDVPDVMLVDAAGAQATRGPLRVRYADYPWGPFSPAQTYLSPGSPDKPGDPYGPGGYLFHYACRDQPGSACTRSDPVRPLDALVPGCPTPAIQLDVGRLYGVNIIDAYTRANGTGLDISWNVSTWNPYAVLLMRSHLEP
jgi:hypothetical protein